MTYLMPIALALALSGCAAFVPLAEAGSESEVPECQIRGVRSNAEASAGIGAAELEGSILGGGIVLLGHCAPYMDSIRIITQTSNSVACISGDSAWCDRAIENLPMLVPRGLLNRH